MIRRLVEKQKGYLDVLIYLLRVLLVLPVWRVLLSLCFALRQVLSVCELA